jgi:hypothetical protein
MALTKSALMSLTNKQRFFHVSDTFLLSRSSQIDCFFNLTLQCVVLGNLDSKLALVLVKYFLELLHLLLNSLNVSLSLSNNFSLLLGLKDEVAAAVLTWLSKKVIGL